jgi:hypothetical protein
MNGSPGWARTSDFLINRENPEQPDEGPPDVAPQEREQEP